MRSRTLIVPGLDGLSGQASPGTGNHRLGACPGRATCPWRAALLALALAGTACRSPSGTAGEPGAPAIHAHAAVVSEAPAISAAAPAPSAQGPVPAPPPNPPESNASEPAGIQPTEPEKPPADRR